MNVEKKVIGSLNKCYSMAELDYKDRHCFLVAAEKQDPCYLFDEQGNKLETVWEKPGGVMTMQQVPGSDGQFLATQKFYSPNDSAEAFIAVVTPKEEGWTVEKIVDAPFVHRFGILPVNGVNHLIVCTLKSDHEYKNDWRYPGAVYTAILPDSLEGASVVLKPLKTGLLKNHGFSVYEGQAVVGTENGTFLFTPPETPDGKWKEKLLLDIPSSDSILLDFDGDGQLELGSIAPFHGNSLTIYHLDEHGRYVPQWKYERPEAETEMIHATWAGMIAGKPVWAVGWRKGTRNTILIFWDPETGTYKTQEIDHNTGAANLMHFVNEKGEDILVATNREVDQIAMFTIKGE